MSNCGSSSYENEVTKVADSYFPFKEEFNLGEPRVYVPIWNGYSSIHIIQKVHPSDVPFHAIPEGCQLAGETVNPSDVPAQLYNLTGTDAAAYNGDTEAGYEDTFPSIGGVGSIMTRGETVNTVFYDVGTHRFSMTGQPSSPSGTGSPPISPVVGDNPDSDSPAAGDSD